MGSSGREVALIWRLCPVASAFALGEQGAACHDGFCFPSPSDSKRSSICLVWAPPGMVMPVLPAHNPANRTQCTLDFKLFQLDL